MNRDHSEFTSGSGRASGALLAVAVAGLAASSACAGLSLGTPFSDGMVLQRDMPIPVWGWAEPGQSVSVTLAGTTQTTEAAADSRWRVALPAMPAGGPHELLVTGATDIRVKDVLVGEVWMCSGQSNMAMALRDVLDAEAHMASTANLPNLRVLGLPVSGSGLPAERLARPPSWTTVTPQTAGGASAVAFFFGRDLVRKLEVPVGLIVVATGGTAIEPWVPREGMDMTPELAQWAADARRADERYRAALANHREIVAAWDAAGKPAEPKDAVPVEPEHPYMARGNDRRSLGTLFNGAVAPVVGYGLRGMIWYQGESNRGDSSQAYFTFHKALVNGWRAAWAQPPSPGAAAPWDEFPFYYVQISALDSWRPNWQIPEIWEGQAMVLRLPNTGMAVIHDLCEDLRNIHPRNKEGVGQRLALWALAKNYGFADLPYAGPIFRSHTVEGSRIRLHFDYTFGGLAARDGKPLDWFTIAGTDHEFVPAWAEVDRDTVLVWSETVAEPVAVRFAWSEAAQPNLVNGAGLPASPFRTHQPW